MSSTQAAPARTRQRQRPQAQGAEGTITVRRALYNMGNLTEVQRDDQERVRVQLFETDPGFVTVGGGVTRNLGDFNSAKVEVRVSLPCYPEASEVERCYQVASATVDDMIRRELELVGGPNDPQS